MNIQEKVSKLVRYCGQYHAHGFMVDERNQDKDFHVLLDEEKQIKEKIKDIKVIILTGEAGDGKTRLLRNIKSLLEQHSFSEPCYDFSALMENEKKNIIERLEKILAGASDERLIILANVGVFTQAVIKYNFDLMKALTEEREDVYLCNFEKRNLAALEGVFREIVENFLKCDLGCPNLECPCHGDCAYRKNIEKMLQPSGLSALRTICDTIYLTGGHITFRELLSLLAYIVTFGEDCAERRMFMKCGGNIEDKQYYNIFRKSDDILLKKVSNLDPALRRGGLGSLYESKEEYVRYKRQLFFNETDRMEQYRMLNVDYLIEFYQVLQYMNTAPYYYDTVQDSDPILQKLKRGIGKVNSRGKSDTGLIITDTPFILGKKIRTEFMVMQDITMVWHRYDLQLGNENMPADKLWNKFYLSYLPEEGTKLISLLIDYQQFRFLMMCSEDYFFHKNEVNVEEYAISAFYSKILQERPQAYDSVVIRFSDKDEKTCDFSLTMHSQKSPFSNEQKQTVRLRREG